MNSYFAPPNHTQVPNVIIDEWMKDLKGSELVILLCICRKTIGWHKQTDKISLTQLEELSGVSRETIVKSTKSLEEKELITVARVPGQPNEYEINYAKAEVVRKSDPHEQVVRKSDCTPPKNLTTTPPKNLTHKRKVNKEKEKDIYTAQFERFWEMYDKKKGKVRAWKKWRKIKEAAHEAIFENVPIFKTHFTNDQYLPYPDKYLHNRYWEDEGFQQPKSKSKSQNHGTTQQGNKSRADRYFDTGEELFSEPQG